MVTDQECALQAARYISARSSLTCRERGLRKAKPHPDLNLPDDFGEADVQAIGDHLRAVWRSRPKRWKPECEARVAEHWVCLPDDEHELIEALDAHAIEDANRLAWRILRDLLQPPPKRRTNREDANI